MLLFRSEDHLTKWLIEKNLTRGAIISLETIWALSKKWYGDRISPDFKGRSLDEAQAILTSVGLTGAFWALRA